MPPALICAGPLSTFGVHHVSTCFLVVASTSKALSKCLRTSLGSLACCFKTRFWIFEVPRAPEALDALGVASMCRPP